MTICFASEYFPPFAPGGAEWSNAALAEALGRRGHRVVVVTPNYGATPVEHRDGVTLRRIPFPVKARPGQREVSWLVNRNPLFYLYFAWQLWRIVRQEAAELIHAQGKGALVPAWLAGRIIGRPVFFTVRDVGLICPLGMCTIFEPQMTFDCGVGRYFGRCVPYFFEHYHGRDSATRRFRRLVILTYVWFDQRLRQWALRRIKGVIGVSREILRVHPERLLGRSCAWVVHPPAPRVEPPSPDEVYMLRCRLGLGQGPLVLYAGKLSLGKGTGVFLEAVDLVNAQVGGARFVLAGKGEWPVPERTDVRHLGLIPQFVLFVLYGAADVVVVPSIWPEPLSRVILEAMSVGRPVVASDVGGSSEAVEHGVTGLLVPKGDAAALARAVSELVLDPERRRRMGEAARRRAAAVFDEGQSVTAVLAAYQDVRKVR